MTTLNWDPFHEVEEMSVRLNRLIGRVRSQTGEAAARPVDWTPLIDVVETDRSWLIKADLADVSREDVKVSVKAGALRIEGERRLADDERNATVHRVERGHGSFARAIALPGNADVGRATAQFERGSLSVVVPKIEPPVQNTIEIKVG